MPIQKTTVAMNFSSGVDTKTDPFQLGLGKFVALQNTVFNKGGLLSKRNGFGMLQSLPNASSTYLTTFNGDATAIGTSLNAYSQGTNQWVNKGAIQPVSLNVLPLIRNNINQKQVDSAIASNGLICTVYTENNGSANAFKYAVADSVTGQNIIAPTAIATADSTYGTPRVFVVGNNFVVLFTSHSGGNYVLNYFYISAVNIGNIGSPVTVASSYGEYSTVSFDAAVYNNQLYMAWNVGSANGISIAYLTSNLIQSSTVTVGGMSQATMISVTVDAPNATIWIAWYSLGLTEANILAYDKNLSTLLAVTRLFSFGTYLNIACSASNNVATVWLEEQNTYSFGSNAATNIVRTITCTIGGVVGGGTGGVPVTILRSVGLASKAFAYNGVNYILVASQSTYQSTYFLINSSGQIIAKVAYGNGAGYLTTGLPSVSLIGDVASVAYLYADLIAPVNKNTNIPSGTQSAGVYSQFGINLVSFNLSGEGIQTTEIGTNLNVTGGFLWSYDGYVPVEHNFFVWPEGITATWSATGGSVAAKPDGSTNTNAYAVQFTYEWTDNQGNAFKSAPSIPVFVTTTGSGTSGSIICNVPTCRLTYKTANPIKIVEYRWSVGQETYYQATPITTPTLNSTTTDSVTITDTYADSTIIGNSIIYTNGGTVENVNAPSTSAMTLFDDRMWLIDNEDQNTLWFSKQVIEATPVEMSDLLTLYVAPTLASQGPTGPMTALASMDDKLIIFKGASGFAGAIYYINGTGPDNTGANSQYSQPTFITSTVGCDNPQSIVFIPNGLMFQSDKGIWLLGRDLSTTYIGSPVEAYNGYTVTSALGIPGTNQVRFTLDNGMQLVYDYFYNQWTTFSTVGGISSTIYQGLHTVVTSTGSVLQETPNQYLDGTNPVLMSFTTGWFNLGGLQGYQRVFDFFLLGTFISPHLLSIQIAYDYAPAPSQGFIIQPNQYNGTYGSDAFYGSSTVYGGTGTLEQWRCQLQQQKCQAFQITLNEIFDSSFGTVPGAGVTLSGIDIVYGILKGYPKIAPQKAIG